MSKHLGHKILKAAVLTLVSIVIIVLLIPVALYIPPVQDFIKDIAVKEASKATGMDISIERLRLKWPLKLSVDRVRIIEASGDTMLTARALDLGVKMRPLFHSQIVADYLMLDSATYAMGNADSLMWLRARIDRAELDGGDIDMNMEAIDLNRFTLDGADISLVMKPDTVTPARDTTATKPMVIRASDITLRRVNYTMSMLPTIDSLGVNVPLARLTDGCIDMQAHTIHARSLSVDSITATYLTPSAAYLKSHPTVAPAPAEPTPDSLMWTITADHLSLTAQRALYAVNGAKPAPGLDMNYLQLSNVVIAVDSFYNRGTSITVPLRRLAATERCGLSLDASGTFAMDSTSMSARGFIINAGLSRLSLDATMGLGNLATDPSVPLSLDAEGSISLADAVKAVPSLRPLIASLPKPALVSISALMAGTMGSMDVNRLKVLYPGLLSLSASGHIDHPLDFNRMQGQVTLDGALTGGNRIKKAFLDAKTASTFSLPQRMAVKGTIDYKPSLIAGNLAVTAGNGRVALKGRWDQRREGYDATIDASSFPVDAFMPDLGVGSVTAHVTARGHGYNPLSRSTAIDLNASVDHVTYQHQPYSAIDLTAHLEGGAATGSLTSANPGADLAVDFNAAIADTAYTWTVNGDIADLNLLSLRLMTDTCQGTARIFSTGYYNPRTGHINGSIDIDHLDWLYGSTPLVADFTFITADVAPHSLSANVNSGDFALDFSSPTSLDNLLASFTTASEVIQHQIDTRNVNVDSLERALPPFTLSLQSGDANPVAEFITGMSDLKFKSIALTASNDSLINLSGQAIGLVSGTTRIDTITVGAIQRGAYLAYSAMMRNAPGTMDEFARVNLNGFLGHDRLTAMASQKNIKGETGYSLGLNVVMADSTATLRLIPYNPMIGYRRWNINEDNYLSYNLFDHHIGANLNITGGNSSLSIITEPCTDGDGHDDHDGEDIVVKINELHLQDWIVETPYSPAVKGDVSADMRFRWDTRRLTGTGNLAVDNLYYDRKRVGSFLADIDLANDPRTGAVTADMALSIDSVKAITVKGTLNDTITHTPFALDMRMIHVPLTVANAFLPAGTATLSGSLNGQMDISGSAKSPVFNGYLAFDSAAVKVKTLGTTFTLSDRHIPLDSGIVALNNFAIKGCNDNPLQINGTANLRDLTNPALDLVLKTRDMMIVNSNRPRGADAYGRAYIDLDGTVKGDMKLLFVDANVALLSGTNVTYIIPEATSALTTASSSADMVKFVQFNDSAQVAAADSVAPTSSMVLNAGLTIQEGSTVSVDLSTDGKNKVQVQGAGTFDFSMSPINSGRLTGRYTINKGFVRYTVPMLGEKLFDFDEGSYVAFNGDMMNPLLNVHAVDHVKANVTQSGQNSRLVTFDVTVGVTGSLEQMNVKFDMSTDDDITVENELQGMTPEQRANSAMNLLLYNTYSGYGTTATGNLSNPLFSFLESQINSWAASNIKGVDISFGIEQYDRTLDGNTSTTTSYSYRVSKSLFNDRFKIIVGGNYSTDANADENFSQNLINDISFEYLLNQSGSMFVRIFRHTGYESILEGEVTQTGVGFVVRRKINTLWDLFKFSKRRAVPVPALDIPATPSTQAPEQK